MMVPVDPATPDEPTEAGSAPTAPAGGAASRLFHRDFALLWQGQLVSQLGDQAFLVAQMFWLMEATGSASLMGLLLMSAGLPSVLLGPFAGTFADRHSRKAIIVVADIGRGGAVVGLAALLFLRPEETTAVVVVLFAVAIWSGVLDAAFQPAMNAAIPDLVPASRLHAANSLMQLSGQGAVFLGQAVGGVAYRLLGAPLLFLVDGVSYLLSALSESFIRLPPAGGATETSERAGATETNDRAGAIDTNDRAGAVEASERAGAVDTDDRADQGDGPGMRPTRRENLREYLDATAEGFRYVWDWPGMRTFILTATAVNFLFMPVFVLLPFYVSDVLARSADWFGFLLASLSLGSLVGLVVAGSLRLEGATRARVLIGAFWGVTVLVAVLGVVQRPLLALATTFAMGMFSAMINVFVLTLVQLSTPARMRGRVMGLVIALAGAASPLGMAVGGILADLTGRNIPATFVAVGLLASALVLLAATRPSFRSFLAANTDLAGTTAP